MTAFVGAVALPSCTSKEKRCAWSVVADDERREREALLSEFVAGGAFCSVCAWCGALVARPLLAAHYSQHKAAARESLARQEEIVS